MKIIFRNKVLFGSCKNLDQQSVIILQLQYVLVPQHLPHMIMRRTRDYIPWILYSDQVKRLAFGGSTGFHTIYPAVAAVITGRSEWRKRPFEPYWVHDVEIQMQAGDRCPHTDLHTQAHSDVCICAYTHTHKLNCLCACLHTLIHVHTRTHTHGQTIDSTESLLNLSSAKSDMFTDAVCREISKFTESSPWKGFLWLQLVPTTSRSSPVQPRGVVLST